MMPQDPKLQYRAVWLAIGYALLGVIIYLSVVSAPPMPDIGFDWQDKLYHLLAYFSLMFWFVQIYHRRQQRLLLALAFTTVGIALEGLQSLNPQRYAEVADMIANSSGVLLAWWLSTSRLDRCLLWLDGKLANGCMNRG